MFTNTGCPKKVLRLINNRRKAFCLISEMFWINETLTWILISYFSHSDENCRSYESLKRKAHSTMKPEGPLNFRSSCPNLSARFIHDSFIFWFNLTDFFKPGVHLIVMIVTIAEKSVSDHSD